MNGKQKNKKNENHYKNATVELNGSDAKAKWFNIAVAIVLFAFGVYHSVLYFGHKAVPNADFTGFVGQGHQILSGHLPSSFKRAPILGLLQAGLSDVIGGQHPDLSAGWIINAVLHPFNIVLLWLVAQSIIGFSAVWLAIIMIINPQIIQSLSDPIAETALIFFVLLTLYFLSKGSKWSYLFAAIATMVRYEGAALILAVFLIDLINKKTKRDVFKAFIYAVLASLPLALWMLATALNWKNEVGTHYLREFGSASGGKIVFVEFLQMLWQMVFQPLFASPPGSSDQSTQNLFDLSRIIALISFVFGSIWGLCKRRWNILAILIFVIPYILIHAMHSFLYSRFCAPIGWATLLICVFGLQSFWKVIDKNNRLPRPLVIILQLLVLIVSIIWLISLFPYLAQFAPISQHSASLPYITFAVIAAIFIIHIAIYRSKRLWPNIVTVAVLLLIVVSNQFTLAVMVGNGERDVEFKLLADWYVANAKPNEKLVCSMSGYLRLFAPAYKQNFIQPETLKGNDPAEFVEHCRQNNITYVTWDSRIGFVPNDRYYKMWGMDNIAMLSQPQSIGPYEFITQIRSGQRFINVFRLRPDEK